MMFYSGRSKAIMYTTRLDGRRLRRTALLRLGVENDLPERVSTTYHEIISSLTHLLATLAGLPLLVTNVRETAALSGDALRLVERLVHSASSNLAILVESTRIRPSFKTSRMSIVRSRTRRTGARKQQT